MIRPLPYPPTRNDSLNFANKADALLAALPDFVEDCNALEGSLQMVATTGTSTSTLTVGVGSKTIATQTGKAWFVGGFVFVASASNPANIMQGQVTSYDTVTGTLVVAVVSFGGSGSASNWLIGLAGIPVTQVSRYSPAELVLSMSTTPPAGTLATNGQTIGSASSGATARANADTEPLFTALWNSTANTELIIQTSAGSNTTRGASAAADFAANKRLPLPEWQDGEALVASVSSAVAARTAGAVLSHTHAFNTGTAGSHGHSIYGDTGSGGGPVGTNNGDYGLTGAARGATSYTNNGGGVPLIGAGGVHSHSGTTDANSGTKNKAAGLFTRVYIAL